MYLELWKRVWWLQMLFSPPLNGSNSAPQTSWLDLRGHFTVENREKEKEGRRKEGKKGRSG